METIKINIDYTGEVTINNAHTAVAPLEMIWFPNNDLIVETKFEKIVFNTNSESGSSPYTIKPKVPDKSLEIVKDVKMQLAKNNIGYYVILNDRYAYKLPKLELEI